MNDVLHNVSSYLKSKHIQMSADNEWLKECCNYYTASNSRRNVEELQSFVFEQWLLADLRDIGEQSLPLHILSSPKCKLDGEYAVQVNEITNIGESYYSQLKHIRSGEAISTFCESDEKTPAWQPKRNRTLKLSLTDGSLTLSAIEFESIVALREPFIPGIKISLVGPIECRRGVLFLTSKSVKILGGEADSLLICNATENILARKLNFEENPNPFNRMSSTQTEDDVECIEIEPDGELDNRSLDSGYNGFENTIDHRHPTTVVFNPNDQRTLDTNSRLLGFGSFVGRNIRGNVTPISVEQKAADLGSRTNICDNWLPSTSTTNITRKENSPIIGVVTPIPSNKRNAESPPAHLGTKSTRTDSVVTASTRAAPDERSSIALVTVQELKNLAHKNSFGTYKCVAEVTKLVHKPRIKNDEWLVVVEIEDETGQCQVTFHRRFLNSQIFEMSAFEVKSQKNMMATNPAVKDRIDDMIRNGVLKVIKLQGEFKIRIIPDNESPEVVQVT